jgi:hypothetical protein
VPTLRRGDQEQHVCEEERRFAHERMQIRLEVDRLESELARWLASTAGRFEMYYAERQRRAA